MPVTGKLEVIVKIDTLPDAETLDDGQKSFEVECGDQVVSVTVKPKVWLKLLQASQDYARWIGVISGKMGYIGKDGFILEKPNIQVFERKPQESDAVEPKAE